MIYQMIAQNPRPCGRVVNPFVSVRKAGNKNQEGNREEITQPNLFRASAQIRRESISLFYQIRNFELDLSGELHALKLVRSWLRGIGKDLLQTIRNITLRISPNRVRYTRLLYTATYLLEHLSPEATVMCRAENSVAAGKLWSLGRFLIEKFSDGFPLRLKPDGRGYEGFDGHGSL